MKKVLFSVLGNMFEWYDYTLYSAFVPIFTKNFFPQLENETIAFVFAFATFAAGYLARPMGGLLLGYISDSIGREVALRLSVYGMTISSFLIGLLPTVNSVGIWATCGLVCLRIMQGISMGGEFGSSAAYLIEIAPNGRKNFYGSFVMFSLAMGILMGTCVFLIIDLIFGQEALINWAWRLPFMFSVFLAAILIKIRGGDQIFMHDDGSGKMHNEVSIVSETINNKSVHGGSLFMRGREQFETIGVSKKDDSHVIHFGNHKKKMGQIYKDLILNKKNALIAFGVALGDGFPFYVFVVAFGSILHSVLGYSSSSAAVVSTIVVIGYAFGTLVSGFLGDRFSSQKVMQFGSLILCVVPFVVFGAFVVNCWWYTCCSAIFAGLFTGLYHGSLPNFLIQSFPVGSRTTIVSLTYSIGMTVFGATAPMICYVFLSHFNDLALWLIPGIVSISAFIAFVAICMRKNVY